MSNLMNHVLMNKLDDELSKAIQEVGGDISGAKGPWDYPEIIKNQLSVRPDSSLPSLDIKLGPGLKIEEINGVKYILATSGALTTCALNPPSGSYKQPIYDVIEAGTPIQKVLEALFYEILPKMPSVYKGDVIKASHDGTDRYNEEDTRSGLIPSATYLRLYVANRQEPVYILLSGHNLVNNESEGGQPGGNYPVYTGGTTQYIKVDIVDGVIIASLTEAGIEKLNEISSLEKSLSDVEDSISSLENSLNEVKDKVDSIGSFDEFDNRLNNIEYELSTKASQAELNALRNVVDRIDLSAVEELSTKVNEIEAEVILKANQSDVDEIQSSLSEIKDSIDGIDLSAVGELSSKVSELETEIDSKANQSDVVEIQNSLSDIDSSVKTLEDAVSNIDLSAVGELSSKVSELETEIDSKVSNSTFNQIKEELETEIDSKANQSDVENINTAVNEIEVELSNKVSSNAVEDIVNSKVNDIVSNESFQKDVENVIINQITDENNIEVQNAITQVVENVVSVASVEDTKVVVNDIFANK